jgi:hypothetical protein
MRNPFKSDDATPVALSVGEDDVEDKAEVQRQIVYPEGYYEYQAQKINPQAAERYKEIFRDWQMGYYTKDDFQTIMFLFTTGIRAIHWKVTRDWGNRMLEKAVYYSISTCSKDGFLRKQIETRVKEAVIKQQKNWKERVKW